MIVKKTLYPKTKRVGVEKEEVYITEKLDGSNLGFGKLDGELFIATRNNIFKAKDYKSEEIKQAMYKGLYNWLEKNMEELEDSLHEGSVIFGEWMGMGRIKYPEEMNHNFYMFAKANIKNFEDGVYNIYYAKHLFNYPFKDQLRPSFIRLVEVVDVDIVPKGSPRPYTIEELDLIYDSYVEKVNRPVEGFIMIVGNDIKKYVRHKNGKLGPHQVRY